MTPLDVGDRVAEFCPAFGACVGGFQVYYEWVRLFSSISYIFYAGGESPRGSSHLA